MNNTPEKPIDFVRLRNFGIVMFIFTSPIAHFQQVKVLPTLFPDSVKYCLLKKLAFHQSVFASTSLSGFYLTMNMVEGHSLENGIEELKKKFWPTLKFNQMLWLPTNLLNFYYFSVHYQFVVMSMVQVVFNVGLSYMHNSKQITKQAAQPVAL